MLVITIGKTARIQVAPGPIRMLSATTAATSSATEIARTATSLQCVGRCGMAASRNGQAMNIQIGSMTMLKTRAVANDQLNS